MTFAIRLWPFRTNTRHTVAQKVSRSAPRDSARPQSPLIAQWRRGSDGRLESRWKSVQQG